MKICCKSTIYVIYIMLSVSISYAQSNIVGNSSTINPVANGNQTVYFDKNYNIVSDKANAAYYLILTKRNGIISNPSKEYYVSDMLHWTGDVITCEANNYVTSGECTWYDEQGKKQSQVTISSNAFNGRFTSWYANGQIKEEVNYVDNMPDGCDKVYDESGNCTSATMVVMGKTNFTTLPDNPKYKVDCNCPISSQASLSGTDADNSSSNNTSAINSSYAAPASEQLDISRFSAPLLKYPNPVSDLKAGIYTYLKTAFTVFDPSLNLPDKKTDEVYYDTVKEVNGTWVISREYNESANYEKVVYEKGSLQPISGKFFYKYGKHTISAEFVTKDKDFIFTYETKKVSSTKSIPKDSTFIIGMTGSDYLLARLPLKEGYEISFIMVNQAGYANIAYLSVKGKETVYGTECYKCDMYHSSKLSSPAETYYFGINDHLLHKGVIHASDASTINTTITYELQEN